MKKTNPTVQVIQDLRAFALADERGETDRGLLEAFVGHQDTAALAALIHRYRRMVWGVCFRVLRKQHDAEDAFQGPIHIW
jgi:hypothetical protein